MRIAVVLVAVAVLLGTRTRVVDACEYDCLRGPPQFEPADGAVLPADPTIYVFVPGQSEYRITASVPIRTDLVGSTNANRVYRVRITASAGDVTVVAGRTGVRYRVGHAFEHHARVTAIDLRFGIGLSITGTAVAYRIDWRGTDAPKHAAFLSGQWPSLDRSMCSGVIEADDTSEREFDLVALFADGSELHLGRSSVHFTGDGARLPLELIDREGIYVDFFPERRWLLRIVDLLAFVALTWALRSVHRSLLRARHQPVPVARLL